uniref:Uncharacterized protein n=1 Tax=Ditylenchus dipsaci TaxID=166011 RepID=A0A915D831_9BILA
MDADATEKFFGYSRSVSSMGNIAAVSIAGYISNRLSNTSPLMIGGQFSALVACFLYVSLNSFPVAPGYIYLSSDLFFGISTGAVSIWRAHVAMTSTEKDRAKAFSMAGLAIFLGMTFGPSNCLTFKINENRNILSSDGFHRLSPSAYWNTAFVLFEFEHLHFSGLYKCGQCFS